MRYRVVCKQKHPSYERITHIGCVTTGALYQRLSELEVIARIESLSDTFYVERPDGHIAQVEIAEREGEKYLKTKPDGERPDNLLSLPECPPSKPAPPPVRRVVAAASHGNQIDRIHDWHGHEQHTT